jgi:hypothetical protein
LHNAYYNSNNSKIESRFNAIQFFLLLVYKLELPFLDQ